MIQGLNCPRFSFISRGFKKNNKLNEVNTLIEEERNAISTLVNDSEEEPIEIFDDLYGYDECLF